MSATSPFERLGPRAEQRKRTRARLYDAALAEFARVGFDRASVAKIARDAGVARASFYFHFPSREHVLLELQWRKELQLVERVRPHHRLADALRALADALVDALADIESPEVARDMLRIYVRRPPQLALDDQPFPLLVEIQGRFASGAETGELRAGIDPERATLLCLSSVFGYLLASAAPPEAQRDDLRTIVSLYLREPESEARS